jgi:cytochrome c-type biogenesis protein CcmH/NrfG
MKLVIEDDEGHRREVLLDRDEISIGRREDNLVHLPERNVSRLHARLLRKDGGLLLEDLHSANGTWVNGVRIQEVVELRSGDVVSIGDYGVALRPDDAPLDGPLASDPMESTAPEIRTDVLLNDTAPHPVVPAALPEIAGPPEPAPNPPPRKLTAGVVVVGLVIGLAVALFLRAWTAEEGGRARQVTPPPQAPVAATQEVPPPAASEPPPMELTPPTVAAQRPSTPTEWLAAARATAGARDFDKALRMLGSVRDPAYQGEVQSLRKTWRLEAAAGRTVQAARAELERGHPTVAQRKLEGARSSRAWAPEVAVLRADIAAALKAPKKGRARPAGADSTDQLYREGKALYDAGDAREATTRFERCLAIDARQPRCHLMLASASVRTGDAVRAEVHYRRFLELASPDDPAVPRVKKFLEDSDAQKKARDASASPQR